MNALVSFLDSIPIRPFSHGILQVGQCSFCNRSFSKEDIGSHSILHLPGHQALCATSPLPAICFCTNSSFCWMGAWKSAAIALEEINIYPLVPIHTKLIRVKRSKGTFQENWNCGFHILFAASRKMDGKGIYYLEVVKRDKEFMLQHRKYVSLEDIFQWNAHLQVEDLVLEIMPFRDTKSFMQAYWAIFSAFQQRLETIT